MAKPRGISKWSPSTWMRGPQESGEAGTIRAALGNPARAVCVLQAAFTVTKHADDFQGPSDGSKCSVKCRGHFFSSLLIFTYLLLVPQGRTDCETPRKPCYNPKSLLCRLAPCPTVSCRALPTCHLLNADVLDQPASQNFIYRPLSSFPP